MNSNRTSFYTTQVIKPHPTVVYCSNCEYSKKLNYFLLYK